MAGTIGLECLGFPVPGESALIAASIDAATKHDFDISAVIVTATGFAAIGQMLGYLIGRNFGYRLLLRYGPYLHLSESHIKLGQYLFLRHGGKIVLAGRFVPVLRSLAGILAGANRMPWSNFMLANVTGAIVWALFYGMGAYLLGQQLKALAQPIGIVLGGVILAFVVAGAMFVRRHQAQLAAEAEQALPGPLKSP